MPTSAQQLNHVKTLIREGKREKAVEVLSTLIEEDRRNPELWWLMANCLSDPVKARRALAEFQSLAPNDRRGSELAQKLEARRLVKQVSTRTVPPRQRRGGSSARSIIWFILAFFAILGSVAALAFYALDLRNQLAARDAVQPTMMVLPSLTLTETMTTTATATVTFTRTPTASATATSTPTDTPTNTPTDTPTSTPTDTPTRTATSTPTSTATSTATGTSTSTPSPTNTHTSTSTPTSTPTRTSTATASPTIETRAEQPPPTRDTALSINPELTPESTAEALALPTLELLPSATSTLVVVSTITSGTTFSSPASLLALTAADQGVLTDGSVHRAVIPPYAEHTWTFSAYRNELITIDVASLTGSGAPILRLLGPDGVEIAKAGSSERGSGETAATLFSTIPADGVYTFVVDFNAVNQQLYRIELKRG